MKQTLQYLTSQNFKAKFRKYSYKQTYYNLFVKHKVYSSLYLQNSRQRYNQYTYDYQKIFSPMML